MSPDEWGILRVLLLFRVAKSFTVTGWKIFRYVLKEIFGCLALFVITSTRNSFLAFLAAVSVDFLRSLRYLPRKKFNSEVWSFYWIEDSKEWSIVCTYRLLSRAQGLLALFLDYLLKYESGLILSGMLRKGVHSMQQNSNDSINLWVVLVPSENVQLWAAI